MVEGRLGSSVGCRHTLLVHCRAGRGTGGRPGRTSLYCPPVRLSIVIPTLNEAAWLPAAVEAARTGAAGEAPEILVADCGSTDGTPALAAALGVEVVTVAASIPGRAAAANAGAARADGDVLLFLDADTLLPQAYDREIATALASPGAVGGAFELAFAGREIGLRLVELVDRIRYRISRQYYGDQAVFVRAEAFRQVSGFPEQALLESADLCTALQGIGRLVLVRRRVLTSPRRFLAGGIYRVFAKDVWLFFLHRLGRPLAGRGEAYWAENRDRAPE